MNSFFVDKVVEYRGYKISMWSDSCLTSMPPIPVYKAKTDKEPIITMSDIEPWELEKAMKLAIDKMVDNL
jgi:hypothetical protein